MFEKATQLPVRQFLWFKIREYLTVGIQLPYKKFGSKIVVWKNEGPNKNPKKEELYSKKYNQNTRR